MEKIKYDLNLMRFISIFTTITRAKVKDCFLSEDIVVFIVGEDEIAKAIGKSGTTAKMVERAINRKIKIVEFNPKLEHFVRNIIYPLKVDEVVIEDGVVQLKAPDMKTRGMLIGRNAQNLKNTRNTLKRHFNITELKVN